MKYAILSLILFAMVFAGCLGGAPEQNQTNETPPPPPPPVVKPVSVSIASPTAGEVIMTQGDTADVTLTMTTQNLILKSPSGAAKKGEGHFKVTVDGGESQTFASKTYVISALAVGEHTIRVELMNNDKTSYSPAVVKEVSFVIEKEKPAEYVPQSYTVEITDSGFDPSSLNVKIGDSVTWNNAGKMPQTATCFIGGKKVFDTGSIASGKNATIKMTEMFECEYYSQLFRALSATIKVESNGTETQ